MSQQDNAAIEINETRTDTGGTQQFLTFVLNDEVYGIGILQIREIIEYANLTVVPLMPDFISGVINLRGNVVPVVNLARRFEHEPRDVSKRTSIVIIDIRNEEGESVEVGIVVDIVDEVIELAESEIAAAPSFGAKVRAEFIEGMGKIDDKLMILLDVNNVLSIDELSTITSIGNDLNPASVSNG